MSYEFNPDSQIFEFPNPYKVENVALILAGILLLLAGTGTLIGVRTSLTHAPGARTLAVLAIAVGLLVFGILVLARAFTQLRYFFGRNRPEDLARQVAPDQDGDSRDAGRYKETLRQNAISFKEPSGALNGLLYSWLPQLIFAPLVLQQSAQTQFNNFLALTATFASFLLCWAMFGSGAAGAWIGLVYGAFALFQIMRPMVAGVRHARNDNAGAEPAQVGIGGLVTLVVLAVLGPVLVSVAGPHLPDLGALSVNGVVCIALVCTLFGCLVFGLALKNQLQPAPQAVGATRVSETVTMNAHPNKLIEELDRILMARWYKRIPNRRYSRRSPDVSGQQGQFAAELFEESQPRPVPNRIASGIGHALVTPQFFWLTCLTGLATIYLLAGTIAAMLATRAIMAGAPVATLLCFALSQFVIGVFCYRTAHLLWGRFDFVSELIWVDLSGSFESASVRIGNQFSGSVQSTKNVINVEAMTMRVWVSEVDTVIFGKDAPRQLIGMRGLPALADELAAALKGFGETRSTVVAPVASQDIERAQQIGALNRLMAEPGQTAAGQRLAGQGASVLPPATPPAPAPAPASGAAGASTAAGRHFCTRCGAGIDNTARFCGQCGAPAHG